MYYYIHIHDIGIVRKTLQFLFSNEILCVSVNLKNKTSGVVVFQKLPSILGM